MLRTRARQQEQEQQPATPHGSVSHITTFTTPIQATVDNDPVRVIATGNVVGKSPAYLVVDEDGESEWLGLDEVRIRDGNFLPNPNLPTPNRKIRQ